MRELCDRVGFITGGASGIGLAIAQAFLGAGMRVAVADINEDYLSEAKAMLGSDVIYVALDVRDRFAMTRTANDLYHRFGRIDVVCNNAGVSGSQPMDEADYDEWDWVLGVNLGGVVNGVKAFVPFLKRNEQGGHIVNTCSIGGFLPSPGSGGIYTTSKFAVRGLTDALRLTLAPHNIGVSLLCPGLTRTRIGQPISRRAGSLLAMGQPQVALNALAVGMDPAEVADAVMGAILENRAYVFPHREFIDELRVACAEVLCSFSDASEPPMERVRTEERRRRLIAEYAASAAAI